MLDTFGILVSSIAMFIVIFRAVQLDAAQPWFKPSKSSADSSGLRLRPDTPVDHITARRDANQVRNRP
jgi:hypothetical protein